MNQHIAECSHPFNFEGPAFGFEAGDAGMRDFHGSEGLMGNFPQMN